MILDTIDHASLYSSAGEGIQKVLRAVSAYSADNYPTGRVALDGDSVFLLLNQYNTQPASDKLMEAHRQYIDVMYMVDGEEMIYVKPTASLQCVSSPYDPSSDALLARLDADTTAVRLTAGSFVVLFPQDAHCPACTVDTPCTVKKIIGKVKL